MKRLLSRCGERRQRPAVESVFKGDDLVFFSLLRTWSDAYFLAALIAHSLASAPELPKNTFWRPTSREKLGKAGLRLRIIQIAGVLDLIDLAPSPRVSTLRRSCRKC